VERTSRSELPPLQLRDARVVRSLPGVESDCQEYHAGNCKILASKGHISVSCRDRYPTWDEIVQIKERLAGTDTEWVMLMPPSSEYVNIHPNCFHIYSKERVRMEWS
jgi:hypothetical protein